MTNLDRIREMTAEELAEFLDRVTISCSAGGSMCENCPLKECEICCSSRLVKWLESEVSENDSK